MKNTTKIKSGIYCILNTINGKRYIGQAVNIDRRIKDHMGSLLKGVHHCKYLQRAFLKCGSSVFRTELLEQCPQPSLTEREQYWMDFYRDRGIYNTAPAAGSTIGYKHTPETLAHLSATWATRPPRTAESRAKQAESMRGKTHPCSAATREKISSSHKGMKMSPEHKARISAALKGKKKDPAHVAKVAEGNRGKSVSEEARAKIGAANRGHKMSEENRQKLSERMTGKRLSPDAIAKRTATRLRNREEMKCQSALFVQL